ncbi:primosomal protein N' [Candidatus Gracilibacteria bacterium]|nr:MAG: primosomal protein N' [Candidatus Gracilibacteria bacterium]PIE85627.1 MAG: primosomal protein N' [Candidatus Gracilibacteria bacterium]
MKIVNLGSNKSSLGKYISSTLLENIEKNIKNKKKVLLYLNKRGEFSSLVCKKCQKLYKCKNCDCSLTVHKSNKLVCHICLFSKNIPDNCDKCKEKELEKVGIGTQQLENKLKSYFDENKKIFRFDSDNIKTVSEKKNVLNNLENADIVIGTKMITTGFNIKNLGLIGIILIEQELQVPKYDTEEKIYQNISQLIGRGNRVGEKTEIIIQTFIPENDTIKSITSGNYKDFLLKTLNERKIFLYPPYTEIASIEYKNKNKNKSIEFIKEIEDILKKNNKNQIEIKKINKIMKKHNYFYSKIIVKGDKLRESLECIKNITLKSSSLNINFD